MGGNNTQHEDVIKWKHFPRYWPFVRGIHRWPVNSPHKGQRRGALMFSLICAWINAWVNNRETDDLRRYRAHYDVIVMKHYIYLRVLYISILQLFMLRNHSFMYWKPGTSDLLVLLLFVLQCTEYKWNALALALVLALALTLRFHTWITRNHFHNCTYARCLRVGVLYWY